MITRLQRLHDRLDRMNNIPIWGLSSEGRIDFKNEATPAQRTQAQTIVDNWEVQTPVATKAQIIANGIDSTNITLAGVTNFSYKIYYQGVFDSVINQGVIADGILELTSIVSGSLVIELIDGLKSNFILIEAI